MLNALYPQVEWASVKCIGLDMDGTLYDEYDFIQQSYQYIIQNIRPHLLDADAALDWMQNRWLEKGSSYPHIYDEMLYRFQHPSSEMKHQDLVEECLQYFRHFSPSITLSNRTKAILHHMRNHYQLFLVTDGKPLLQRNKYNALSLHHYIPENYCLFTGDSNHDKTSLTMLPWNVSKHETVYIGDRTSDETMAKNLGLRFLKVYNMIGIS